MGMSVLRLPAATLLTVLFVLKGSKLASVLRLVLTIG